MGYVIFSVLVTCFIVAQVIDYAVIGYKEIIIGILVTVMDTVILIWLSITLKKMDDFKFKQSVTSIKRQFSTFILTWLVDSVYGSFLIYHPEPFDTLFLELLLFYVANSFICIPINYMLVVHQ